MSYDYDYVNGDPVNNEDLAGTWCVARNHQHGCKGGGLARAIGDTARHPVGTFKSGYRGMSPTGQGVVAATLRAAPVGVAVGAACIALCEAAMFAVGGRLATSAAVGQGSALFARSGGSLNSGFIRMGWGWSAPLQAQVFRLAVSGSSHFQNST